MSILDNAKEISGGLRNGNNVASGTVSGSTLTLTLEDGSTVDVDVNTLVETNVDTYVASAAYASGTITLTMSDSTTVGIDVSSLNIVPTTTVQGGLVYYTDTAGTLGDTGADWWFADGKLKGAATKLQLVHLNNNSKVLIDIKPDYDGANYGWVNLIENGTTNIGLPGRVSKNAFFKGGASFGATAGPSETYSVTVTDGGIGIEEAGEGIVLTSPNGTLYKLTVDDSGNLTTAAV